NKRHWTPACAGVTNVYRCSPCSVAVPPASPAPFTTQPLPAPTCSGFNSATATQPFCPEFHMTSSWRSSFRRVSAVSAMTLLTPLALAQSSPAFTPEQQAAYPTDAWISNGGSLNNQRYSPLDQINKSNVA